MSPGWTYLPDDDARLPVDRDLYGRLGEPAGREAVEEFVIPIRSGRAWEVRAGQICRVT